MSRDREKIGFRVVGCGKDLKYSCWDDISVGEFLRNAAVEMGMRIEYSDRYEIVNIRFKLCKLDEKTLIVNEAVTNDKLEAKNDATTTGGDDETNCVNLRHEHYERSLRDMGFCNNCKVVAISSHDDK
mmetsp:Transcript_3915/g.7210  ORF Transcript_3915/g.7210 Transcript_3915/m.7210 type:complete len:128 (+) Transcript_3915:121-504(+)